MADLRLVHDQPFTVEFAPDIEPHPSSYLVKNLLPHRGLVFVAGASTTGKSFVMLDWFLRIASEDMEVMGRRTKHGGVIYVGAEDADGLRRRVKAWRIAHNRAPATFGLIPYAPDLRREADVERLVDLIVEIARDWHAQDIPLMAVAFDTLSQVIPGAEENASGEMSAVLRVLNMLGAHLDCLIVALAHTGKDEMRGIRGWSGLRANADAVIMLERDAITPSLRTITLDKIKNGPDGQPVEFTLQEVSIGRDEDGEVLLSCVPEYGGPASAKQKTKRVGPLGVYLIQAIERMRNQDRMVQERPPTDLPRWARGVTISELKKEAEVVGLYDARDTEANKRQKWHRAQTSLVDSGKARVVGDYLWSW